MIVLVVKKCSFHQLPKERLPLFNADITERYTDNTYELNLGNPLVCPVRFALSSDDPRIDSLLGDDASILVAPFADTTIVIKDQGDLRKKLDLRALFGDPALPIKTSTLKRLPFPKDKSYKLLQGNNSYPTHNSLGSRYAFDFTLSKGDTVTSAQDGFVVGVVEGYTGWGRSSKWKPYANQVIVYDTASHLFTQYGHLKKDGSLVEVGDAVTIGQPIALSGLTGETSEEHLHFNVFRADDGKGGLRSYPLDSIGQYKVKELKRCQRMTH